MSVQPVPAGYNTITPYLIVDDAAAQIEFLEKALGATLIERHDSPNGKVRHANMKLGTSMVMVADAMPDWPSRSAMYYLYVEDADALYQRAIAAGAKSVSEMQDMFYGDRHGAVADPNGNQWWLSTHIEDVAPDELERRMKAQFTKEH